MVMQELFKRHNFGFGKEQAKPPVASGFLVASPKKRMTYRAEVKPERCYPFLGPSPQSNRSNRLDNLGGTLQMVVADAVDDERAEGFSSHPRIAQFPAQKVKRRVI
jgi:hypothetical protein